MFYIPDFMEIQTPRAFPNRPERWWDNLESAEDFSHGEGRLFPNAPAYFHRGAALFFSPIPQGMGNTIVPTEEKGGSSVLYSGFHGNSNPKGFPKLPGAMAGQSGKRGRFFPGKGRLSRYAPAHFCSGAALFSPPNPEWDGNTKLPLLLQKVGVVFIRAKPIDKSGGKKTEKGLGGASCILPQPLRMRKLKCMPPPAFQAAFSFPPVKTSCFIGVQCVY
ncbi:MAG TPA: hypothetical protein H9988_06905 [Candidatus Acutalibacter stercoravium]|nr:hypothetical protein [Candidatus Acutalibacter stercoravium]